MGDVAPMAPHPTGSTDGSFLLELLYYAGWRVQVRDGVPARIRAHRDGVEVDVAGESLAVAAARAFAGAMRSGRPGRAARG